MFLLDSLLINGIHFVLDKVAAVAGAELNDPDRQRERLLEAQLKLESGEIGEAEYSAIEADVFERMRELKRRAQQSGNVVDEKHRVSGIDITIDDDA